MSRLTEEQRDDLIRALLEPDDDCAHNMIPLYAAVERIVAEREAADRADERERIASTLLDKWRSLPVWGPDERGLMILDGVDLEGLIADVRALAEQPYPPDQHDRRRLLPEAITEVIQAEHERPRFLDQFADGHE